MSTLVLARKYRPRNFESLVGQPHVVQALGNALTQQRLHHAYLFTGTRGVGKTTISRILAKSLNCTGPNGDGGITATPCGRCDACRDIDAGRFIDYVELDAASNRGVDEITQLLDQAVYKPVLGRFKVYMIDEVHMLSNHAFNAMLKTLEEPPEYLKFVLATTDPQKVPATVLSRCLQFNLRPLAPQTIAGHLVQVLAEEALAAEPTALQLIARAARGSMRDALSLADQAVAFGAGAIDEAGVRQMLGAVDRSHATRLVEALAARNGAAAIAAVDQLRALGLSAAGTLEEMAALLQQMAVEQAVPGATDGSDPSAAELPRLAALLAPDETQLLYSIVLHGRAELGLAPDEYSGLVMVLLRMLAFPPQPERAAATGRAEAGGAESPPSGAGHSAAPSGSRPSATAEPAADFPSTPRSATAPAATAPSTTAPFTSARPATAPSATEMPAKAAAPASDLVQDLRATQSAGPGLQADALRAPSDQRPTQGPRPAAAAPPDRAAAESSALTRSTGVRKAIAPAAPDANEERARSEAETSRHDPQSSGLEPPDWVDAPIPLDLEPAAASPLVGARPEVLLPAVAAGVPASAAGVPAPGSPVLQAGPRSSAPADSSSALDAPDPALAHWGDRWADVVRRMNEAGSIGALVRELAMQAQCVAVEEGAQPHVWRLRVEREMLRAPAHCEKLQAALGELLGCAVRIHTEPGAASDSPARRDAQERARRQAEAEHIIHNDPLVQALMAQYKTARIVPGSVRAV